MRCVPQLTHGQLIQTYHRVEGLYLKQSKMDNIKIIDKVRRKEKMVETRL